MNEYSAQAIVDRANEEIERKHEALKGAVALGARAIGKHYPPKLAASLLAVQRAIGKIENDKQNAQFGFGYQSIGNVIEHLNPLLNEHGIGIIQSELGVAPAADNENMLAVTYEFTIFNEAGDVWPDRPHRTGLASIWSRPPKGTQEGAVDPLAINKAESQAYKFFVKRMFAVRAGDALPDNDGDTAEIPAAWRTEIAEHPEQRTRQSTRGRKPKMGEPRLILVRNAEKLSIVEAGKLWLRYFQAAINQSETGNEVARWCELNNDMLEKLGKVTHTNGAAVGLNWLQDARTCVAQKMKELIESETKPAEITSGRELLSEAEQLQAKAVAEINADIARRESKQVDAVNPEEGKTAAAVAETAAKAAADFDDLAIPADLQRKPAAPLTYEQMRDKVVAELEKGMSLEQFADYKVGLADWQASLSTDRLVEIERILNAFLLKFWEAETTDMIKSGGTSSSQQQLATVKTANLLSYKEEIVKLDIAAWNRVVALYTETVRAVQAYQAANHPGMAH